MIWVLDALSISRRRYAPNEKNECAYGDTLDVLLAFEFELYYKTDLFERSELSVL